MAKELPYFQFEPAEYLTGDVSFCSLSAQGLFIIICSYYWNRRCILTKEQFLKRVDKPNEFQELVDEKIISIENNHIKIAFLDEQIDTAIKLSNRNSINGKKGGAKKGNTNAKKQPTNEPKTTQKQSTRQDKTIQEEIKQDNNNFYSSEIEFLNTWNDARKKLLKKESNISKMSMQEKTDFNLIKGIFTKEQFKDGMRGLFMQKDMFASNILRPKHFLSDMNIEKYIDAFKNDNQIYETKNKFDTKL